MFVELGILADEKKAKDFFNILDAGRQIMLGLAAAAVGTTLSIGAMFDKTMNAAIALSNFSAATGLSAQELQRWQHAGEALGLTTDEVTGSITNLNRELEIEKRAGGGKLAAALGQLPLGKTIFDFKNALDLLKTLQDNGAKLKNVPAQTLSNLLSAAGMSENMAKLFKITPGQFGGLANSGAIFSDADINRMMVAHAALVRLGETISYIFGKALIDVTPALLNVVNALQKWSDQNRGQLQAGIKVIVEMVIKMSKEVTGAFHLIDQIIKSTIGWKNAVLLLVAAFALLNPTWGILMLIVDALNELNTFVNGSGTWSEKLNNFFEGKGGLLSHFAAFGVKIAEYVAKGIEMGLAAIEPDWWKKMEQLGKTKVTGGEVNTKIERPRSFFKDVANATKSIVGVALATDKTLHNLGGLGAVQVGKTKVTGGEVNTKIERPRSFFEDVANATKSIVGVALATDKTLHNLGGLGAVQAALLSLPGLTGKYAEAGLLRTSMGWQGTQQQRVNLEVNQTIHTSADGNELMRIGDQAAMRMWSDLVNQASLQLAGGR